MIGYLMVAGSAALVSFISSFVLWKLARRFGWYPEIRSRDVHKTPTPRLGGIAVFLSISAAMLVASAFSEFESLFANPRPLLAILIAAFVVVALGVVDDLIELDWLTKLSGQFIVAGIVAWQGVQIVSLPIGGITIFSPTLSLVLTVLAIVLVMNAVNFIDGLDGLASGVALISNAVFFLYVLVLSLGEGMSQYFGLATMVTVLLAGALLGFFPLNWNPAKLFLGDSGALLVGLLMSVSAISVTGQINPGVISPTQLLPAFLPLILPLAVLIVPLVDFSLAVARRLRRGGSPFDADRAHLHHRLLDMGHSHRQAVLILYSWTAVLAIGTLMFLFVDWYLAAAIIGMGLVGATLVTFAPRKVNHPSPSPHDEKMKR